MVDERTIIDYDVVDAQGNKIGNVENMWIDENTGRPEFLGVKTGWLFGGTHVVPVENARLDEDQQVVQIPYTQDVVKDSPSMDKDANLSPEQEMEIRRYFGETRAEPIGAGLPPMAPAREGERREEPLPPAGMERREGMERGREETTIPLAEERLEVGKRDVGDQTVRLRKVVRTEEVTKPVELRREELQLEREPARGERVPDNAFEEKDIEIPLKREEAVINKTAEVTGEVHAYKTEDVERRDVRGEVRKEDVEVEGGERVGRRERSGD